MQQLNVEVVAFIGVTGATLVLLLVLMVMLAIRHAMKKSSGFRMALGFTFFAIAMLFGWLITSMLILTGHAGLDCFLWGAVTAFFLGMLLLNRRTVDHMILLLGIKPEKDPEERVLASRQ